MDKIIALGQETLTENLDKYAEGRERPDGPQGWGKVSHNNAILACKLRKIKKIYGAAMTGIKVQGADGKTSREVRSSTQFVNIGLQVVSPKLVTREEVQQVSYQQRAELANSLVTFYEIQRANAITAAGLMGTWNPPAVASTTTTSTGSNSVASSTLKPPAKRQKSPPVPKPSKQEKVEKTYDPAWTAREWVKLINLLRTLGYNSKDPRTMAAVLSSENATYIIQEPECFQTRISDSRGASANNLFNQGMKLYRAAMADFNTASETDSSLRRPVEPPSGGREGEDVTYRDAFSAWVLQRKNHIITYMQKNSGQSSIWTDEAACEAMFDLHRGSLVGEEFAQESSSRFRSSTASSESSASSDDTGIVRKTGRDRDGT
eukprot:g62467.t1